MKVLGELYDESKGMFTCILEVTHPELEVMTRALALDYATPQWQAEFKAWLVGLGLSVPTFNCLAREMFGHYGGAFQKEDGSLYDFESWAELITANYEQDGIRAEVLPPFLLTVRGIGRGRYLEIVTALQADNARIRELREGQAP